MDMFSLVYSCLCCTSRRSTCSAFQTGAAGPLAADTSRVDDVLRLHLEDLSLPELNDLSLPELNALMRSQTGAAGPLAADTRYGTARYRAVSAQADTSRVEDGIRQEES